MTITLCALAVAIFLTILKIWLLKKSQHNPPITERGTRSSNITVYYVNIALGLCIRVRKFLSTQPDRKAYSENKCEAAGGLAHNFKTLRSMGRKLRDKEKQNTKRGFAVGKSFCI